MRQYAAYRILGKTNKRCINPKRVIQMKIILYLTIPLLVTLFYTTLIPIVHGQIEDVIPFTKYVIANKIYWIGYLIMFLVGLILFVA